MTLVFKKRKDPYFPLGFKGLNEKELASLYNIASIEKVNAGDVLFREGDSDASLRFVLDGSVKIEKKLNGQVREVAVLSGMNSVEEIAFKTDKRRTASAIAVGPSTIMALDEKSLNALSPEIQLSIYRSLNELVTKRLTDLIEKERELSTKNKHLVSYIRDYLQARNDDYAHSEVIQRILKSFPRLPMYASKLAVRLLDEDVSASEVIDLAKLDPSLVGMVLKTVNSAYYNLQGKISNFQQAVLLLGFNQVYQLVIAHGIRSIMPDTSEFQELQSHSILVSLISFEISQLCNTKKCALHSTIGLLHDIGKSIILLLKQQYPKLKMIVDMLGHSKIGSVLLKEWNIPEVICLSIEHQYYQEFSLPTEIPAEYRENVAVLYLAHLCEAYLQGKSEGELPSPFLHEYMRLLHISEKTVAELVKRYILPSMTKKLNIYPENVRHLLVESENRLMEENLVETEELPIVWNI